MLRAIAGKVTPDLAKSLDAELRIESDPLGLTTILTLPAAVDAVKCLEVVEG